MQQIKHFTSSDNRRGQTATNVHISEAPDITVNDWLVFFALSQTMCADVCEWGKKENKKKEKKERKILVQTVQTIRHCLLTVWISFHSVEPFTVSDNDPPLPEATLITRDLDLICNTLRVARQTKAIITQARVVRDKHQQSARTA